MFKMELIRAFKESEKAVQDLKNKRYGGDTVELTIDDIQHLFNGGTLYGDFNDEYVVTIVLKKEWKKWKNSYKVY